MIEYLHTHVRAYRGRPIATNLLGFSVATELSHPVSRQFFYLFLFFLFFIFYVATGFLAAGTFVS